LQHAPNVTLPRTAADALKMWDAGEPVPAFRVESEGASQQDIWAFAFDLMRLGRRAVNEGARSVNLNGREEQIAWEIFRSAAGHGFAGMVQTNLHGDGHPIFVQKPKAADDRGGLLRPKHTGMGS
jgi:hypothetical protein